MEVRCKRIYREANSDDGFRILVDRLWPRGFTKEKAKIDLWLKEIAPSNELRKWSSHDAEKWPEFLKRYAIELEDKKELIAELKKLIKEQKKVTFLFAAKNEEYNNAVALKDLLNV